MILGPVVTLWPPYQVGDVVPDVRRLGSRISVLAIPNCDIGRAWGQPSHLPPWILDDVRFSRLRQDLECVIHDDEAFTGPSGLGFMVYGPMPSDGGHAKAITWRGGQYQVIPVQILGLDIQDGLAESRVELRFYVQCVYHMPPILERLGPSPKASE